MKVVLVGDFPPPHGGLATHVEELFRAVRAGGGESIVLDIGKGQLPAAGVVPAGNLPRFTALLASYAARGFRVHLHTSGANPKSWALALACAAAARLGKDAPLLTLHSGLCPPWLVQSAVRRTAARAIVEQYGTVIAVSGAIRDALVSCGVEPARIEVVPAFSHKFLRPGAPPPRLQEVRAQARPLFSAMLAPSPVYGQDVLLRAFAQVRARIPSARLAAYGVGTESLRAEGVTGFGELHRPSALALIEASDVFVRPTLVDGDSVSVREALALGRVVVATRAGNRPPEARLVPPGDADALARGLLEAAEQPPRAKGASGQDPIQRVLALYGGEEAAPCAASAAS
jgi:glycosyltransferase involved in cell wall biosynthesis